MAKSKKSQKKIDKSAEEQEKLKMLAKADEIKGEQLAFTKEGEFVNQKEVQSYYFFVFLSIEIEKDAH